MTTPPSLTSEANWHSPTTTSAGYTRRLASPSEALESYRRTMVIQHRLADDNPSVTEFRSRLADSQSNIGWFLVMNGRAAEAVAEFSGEEAIRTRLVREGSVCTGPPGKVGELPDQHGDGPPPTRQALRSASTVRAGDGLREPLVKEHPETPIYLLGLGESLLRAGLARRDEGDATGAAADWRRADGLLERSGALRPDLPSCTPAATRRCPGRPGSRARASRRARLRPRPSRPWHCSGLQRRRAPATPPPTETRLPSTRSVRPDFGCW